MDPQLIRMPHLHMAQAHPFFAIEKQILDAQLKIESWFRSQWQLHQPVLTSSVDLRNAVFKLAAIDTNLFPAGFQNLNPAFYPLCIQAAQSVISHRFPYCQKILIIAESHTRNIPYYQSLATLFNMLQRAGYAVRIGSLTEVSKQHIPLPDNQSLTVYPIERKGTALKASDFTPCLILLNNDLSESIPEILLGLSQTIEPPPYMGWSLRSKARHFEHYARVCDQFSEHIGIDPWRISAYIEDSDQVDFLEKKGFESLMEKTDLLLKKIQTKYQQYHIDYKPFVIIKADAGTYGMAVMTIYDASELKTLNRKQRTHMSVRKGAQKVNHVILQEGIPTFETFGPDHASAEPVIYLIGEQVIGGFYRVHHHRGRDQNLNSPGMGFEMLSFEKCCNNPLTRDDPHVQENQFYIYSVIARLAALAASLETEDSAITTKENRDAH